MKTTQAPKTVLTLALTAAIGAAGMAHAASGASPFSMTALESGYMVAAAEKGKEGKCGEGKCGAQKAKAKEAKCGGDKAKEAKCGGQKAKEGKCGGDKSKDGKCGANK